MSLGVAVLNKLVALASKTLRDFDIEIVEQHHRHKVDSPSGTALTLAEHAASARDLDLILLEFQEEMVKLELELRMKLLLWL